MNSESSVAGVFHCTQPVSLNWSLARTHPCWAGVKTHVHPQEGALSAKQGHSLFWQVTDKARFWLLLGKTKELSLWTVSEPLCQLSFPEVGRGVFRGKWQYDLCWKHLLQPCKRPAAEGRFFSSSMGPNNWEVLAECLVNEWTNELLGTVATATASPHLSLWRTLKERAQRAEEWEQTFLGNCCWPRTNDQNVSSVLFTRRWSPHSYLTRLLWGLDMVHSKRQFSSAAPAPRIPSIGQRGTVFRLGCVSPEVRWNAFLSFRNFFAIKRGPATRASPTLGNVCSFLLLPKQMATH